MSDQRAGVPTLRLEQLADLIGLPREVVQSHCATEELPLFLTAAEAAQILRISVRSVNVSCRNSELPGQKVAGEWRVPHLAVLAAAFGIDLDSYLPRRRPELVA